MTEQKDSLEPFADAVSEALEEIMVEKQNGLTEAEAFQAVADKKKWLQEVFKKKEPSERGGSAADAAPGHELIMSRMKWLAERGKGGEGEVKKSYNMSEIVGVSAQEKAKWLQEQAFRKEEEDVFEDSVEHQVSNELVSGRMKWLAEQNKSKEGSVKKSYDASEITGVSAQDRAKWLQEQAFRKAEEEEGKAAGGTQIGNDLVSDRMKWLAEQGKAKEGEVKKTFNAAEIVGVSAQEKAKWLREEAFRQLQAAKAKDASEPISNELVSDRLKRLAEQGKGKESEIKKSYNAAEISGVSAQEKARWLQEQAFRQAEIDKKADAASSRVGNELVSDRMKWLADQGKVKEGEVKKSYNAAEISGVSAQEKARWLQEQAFRQAQEAKAKDETEPQIGNELVSDRMRWLAEQGKAKEGEVKKSYNAAGISGVSAQEKARWLQEQAFRQSQEAKAKGEAEPQIGNELVSDRMRWLADKGRVKEGEVKKSYNAAEISGVSAQEKARWLQEQAFRQEETDKKSEAAASHVGNEPASDRMKQIAVQGQGTSVALKMTHDSSQISGVRAQDRTKWLQDRALREDQGSETKKAESVGVTNEPVSDRIKKLPKKKEEEETRKSYNASVTTGASAQEKARRLQEQACREAEKDERNDAATAYASNDLVSDRMRRVTVQGARKGEVRKSLDALENSGVNAQGKPKWMREQAVRQPADEQKRTAEVQARNEPLPDRKKWVREQASAASKECTDSSQDVETLTTPGSESGGVNDVVNAFGGVAKKKTAVQLRKEAFERLEMEKKKQADPRSYLKVSWQQAGSGPGQFKKTVKNPRGIAPKKTFTDLP